MNGEKDKLSLRNENGFLGGVIEPASGGLSKHVASTSEQLGSERLSSVLSGIKELVRDETFA